MSYLIQTVSFEKALPVWAYYRETEMNLWLSFRTIAGKAEKTVLRLTGSAAYDVKVNGKFIAFGPARSAHGYFRVDELDLSAYIEEEAVITIAVAGYNCNSYYHLDQPSFLTAELIQNGAVVAATGHEGFLCRVMTEHMQKVLRYSLQRTFCEVYELSPTLEAWEKDPHAKWDHKSCALLIPAVSETERIYIPRGSSYNVYDRIPAEKIVSRLSFAKGDHRANALYPSFHIPRTDNPPTIKGYAFSEIDRQNDSFLLARNIEVTSIVPADEENHPEIITAGQGVTYKMAYNTTGKLVFDAVCEEDTEIVITFDEFLGENGLLNFRRMYTVNSLVFRMKRGTYHISTFEPYTIGALQLFITHGKAEISNLNMIYFGAEKPNRRYQGNDPAMQKIFDAAVETYRQNTFTTFMDCPSRERAAWLCDSFFTSRVERVLTGKSEIEHVFLENYVLPDTFKFLPKGMFAMCYPGDHNSGSYIPNWAMWLVLELEEYLARTGDHDFINKAKSRIDGLLRYFTQYENKDGLLEKLDKWVFVEWSEANQLTQDVNFPTNMLYARMLIAASNLYGDESLRQKAEKIRIYINQNTITENGFYCDNAVYDENGKLHLSGKCTETCQYYAFFCGTTTPAESPALWRRMVEDFGPRRVSEGKLLPDAKWQEIYPSNAFIGNYLRLELLYLNGEHEKLLCNIREFFLPMAELTGTLWEMADTSASCNHGFASHVLYWMDKLGMIN